MLERGSQDHINQIESIENYYKNKFDLLNEHLQHEHKQDTQIREKAQHEILGKMKSQLRKKLETDIRDLQDQLCKDEDNLYWREKDADQLQKVLKFARFQTKV
jgi:hypothetical protein